MELSTDGRFFFWEQGRFIQLIDISTGKMLKEIDCGEDFRTYFHRIAGSETRLFVCLNGNRIMRYDLTDLSKAPEELEIREPYVNRKARPLELLLHRNRLVLLLSEAAVLWDVDTLKQLAVLKPRVSLEGLRQRNGGPLPPGDPLNPAFEVGGDF